MYGHRHTGRLPALLLGSRWMTSLPPPQHVSEIVLGVFLCSGLGEGHGLEGTFLSFPEGHVPKSHGLALTEHSIWHQTVAIRKRQKLHKWTKQFCQST